MFRIRGKKLSRGVFYWKLRRIRNDLAGRSRFRQVQRRIRRDRKGKLPLNLYGRWDILSKDDWKKAIRKYNPGDPMISLGKVEQKLRLEEKGVSIPDTYLVLDTEEDIDRFSNWMDKWEDGFVIKPSGGHGGSGVLVIDRKIGGRFFKPSGKHLERERIINHARRIMEGLYTRGRPDSVLVEERLSLSKQVWELMTPGLLDIRVVVFKGFPVMAMTRLPTRRSGGRANIHKGAVAAGISISEGAITSATYNRRSVKRHPSTDRTIIGFRFNMWDTILEQASAAADAMGMGFAGVDLCVDRKKGVVVIEVNKRPGLEIQNANRSGLKRRMRYVKSQIRREEIDPGSVGPGVKAEISRNWDGRNWERERGEAEEE